MLPKYQLKFKTFELPSGKNIDLTRMTIKIKKELLLLSEQEENKLKIIEKLVKECSNKDTSINKLSLADVFFAFFQIIILSEGNEFEFKFKCLECGKENEEIKINLTEALKVKEFTGKNLQKIDEDLYIQFQPLNFYDYMKIKEKYSTIVERKYYELLYSIKAIKYEGKVFKDFSIKEIEEFIDSLPSDLYELILLKYEEVRDKVYIDYILKCKFCNKEFKLYVEDIDDFFV